MTTVRPVASLAELARVESVIAAQFPPRRGAPSHGSDVLRGRFAVDRALMLVAERDGEIVGGALAFRAGGAVKIEVIALAPEARRSGIGRELVERIEDEAMRLGARRLYLGGATADNRGFYWRLGFSGRRSLMQKAIQRLRTDVNRGSGDEPSGGPSRTAIDSRPSPARARTTPAVPDRRAVDRSHPVRGDARPQGPRRGRDR